MHETPIEPGVRGLGGVEDVDSSAPFSLWVEGSRSTDRATPVLPLASRLDVHTTTLRRLRFALLGEAAILFAPRLRQHPRKPTDNL